MNGGKDCAYLSISLSSLLSSFSQSSIYLYVYAHLLYRRVSHVGACKYSSSNFCCLLDHPLLAMCVSSIILQHPAGCHLRARTCSSCKCVAVRCCTRLGTSHDLDLATAYYEIESRDMLTRSSTGTGGRGSRWDPVLQADCAGGPTAECLRFRFRKHFTHLESIVQLSRFWRMVAPDSQGTPWTLTLSWRCFRGRPTLPNRCFTSGSDQSAPDCRASKQTGPVMGRQEEGGPISLLIFWSQSFSDHDTQPAAF